MNFKLKALVAAAVATVTMSGAANALTNDEMFLVAYDNVALKTFVAALGDFGTTSGFTGSVNQTRSFAADVNWNSFVSSTTTANTAYQVLGFNSVGNGGLGATDKLLVTTNNIPPFGTNVLTNQQMTNLMNDENTSTGAVAQFFSNNASATGTGTSFVTGTGIDSGANVNTNVFTKVLNIPDTTATLGSNLNFYQLTRPVAVTNFTQMVTKQFVQQPAGLALRGAAGVTGDFWNLGANGVLTYTGAVAAVPEADTSAMMLAGLGLMGFVARRRKV